MAENLVNVDRDRPMLLPAELRQWVPEDDLVHFGINAVETMKLPRPEVVQSVGPVQRMLADGGYVNAQAIGNVGQKVDLYIAIARADHSYRR